MVAGRLIWWPARATVHLRDLRPYWVGILPHWHMAILRRWRLSDSSLRRSGYSVDSTSAAFIVCGPLQFLVYVYLDRRSFQIRYAAVLKLGTGHAFKCLGWPCPATFNFLLFEKPIVTLCAPCVLRGASGLKVRNLNGSLCNSCALDLGLALHIFATKSMGLSKDQKSCPLLRSCFIGSCRVWRLKTSFT